MAKQTKKNEKSLVFIFAYLLAWLSGLIVYITAGQENKRMKFHAIQAIFLGVIGFVISFIPIIGLIWVLVWLYGMYIGWRAYEGEDVEVPYIGDYAHHYSQ